MSASPVRCPLCGFCFPGVSSCPTGCPLRGACHTLCCPNCNYRFLLTAPLTEKIVGWFKKRKSR